ncbi:hypothetical protein ACQ4M3_38940 [Leptolyngbya sp. AN03gr2]|uniref:hypothetical protein n=1 Tax=unclassified Leptolyngbya TaxID=2650499 RepID=UPI003D3176C0
MTIVDHRSNAPQIIHLNCSILDHRLEKFKHMNAIALLAVCLRSFRQQANAPDE